MQRRLTRREMRRFEDMTVFARFKYSHDLPAFRVHMWEVFDNANYSTKSFEDLFTAIYEKMAEMFDDEGFASDVEEISQHSESS